MDVFATYITVNGAPGRNSSSVQEVRTRDELLEYGHEMWYNAYSDSVYMYVSVYVRSDTPKSNANLTYQKIVTNMDEVEEFMGDIWDEWEKINLREFIIRPNDARLSRD